MTELFSEKQIFVKEKVRMFRFGNVFEFFNLSNVKLGEAREEEITKFKKVIKLTKYKSLLPFTIVLYDNMGEKIVRLNKPFKFWLPIVNVYDKQNQKIGSYKSKFRFFKPTFSLRDNSEQEFAKIEGNIMAWNFKITSNDSREIGTINKKFAGVAKELFTTSDNYLININNELLNEQQRKLLTSVACVIDMIFKEYKH